MLALGDHWRLHDVAPSAFVDDGMKPVYRVRTRSGREIRTTSTHPFLTPTAGCRSERSPSARASPSHARSRCSATTELSDDEISLLGLLVGGEHTDTSPRVTTTSPEVLAEVRRCATALGVEVQRRGDVCSFVTTSGPNCVSDLCRTHGIRGSLAHERRVPPAAFRLPRPQVARFLNRLFAIHGSVVARPDGHTIIEYRTGRSGSHATS